MVAVHGITSDTVMPNPQPNVLANTHQPARETFPLRTNHCNMPVTAPPKAATPVELKSKPKLNDSSMPMKLAWNIP